MRDFCKPLLGVHKLVYQVNSNFVTFRSLKFDDFNSSLLRSMPRLRLDAGPRHTERRHALYPGDCSSAGSTRTARRHGMALFRATSIDDLPQQSIVTSIKRLCRQLYFNCFRWRWSSLQFRQSLAISMTIRCLLRAAKFTAAHVESKVDDIDLANAIELIWDMFDRGDIEKKINVSLGKTDLVFHLPFDDTMMVASYQLYGVCYSLVKVMLQI